MFETITGLLKTIGNLNLPFFSQTVSEFAKPKTNQIASGVFAYGMYLVAQDENSLLGNFYIVIALFAWTIRDALVKIEKRGSE